MISRMKVAYVRFNTVILRGTSGMLGGVEAESNNQKVPVGLQIEQ
jgi:hypothetical protein